MEQLKSLLEQLNNNSRSNTPTPKSSTRGQTPKELKRPVYRAYDHNTPAEWSDYHEKINTQGYAALPTCPVCHGLGFITPLDEFGKPVYGKTITCKASGCLTESRQLYQSGASYLQRIGVSNTSQTFGNFKQVLGTEETYSAFYHLAFTLGSPPMLLVIGGTGNGKTHLCNALAMELVKKHMGVRIWAVADLCAELKKAMADNTVEIKVESLKTIPVLILDEYGDVSDWEAKRLVEVIDYRYREAQREKQIITVVTTNLDITQLPERMTSRFAEKSVAVTILNTGLDYRKQ